MTAPRFWRNIRQRYRIVGTECRTCGKAYFPPRDICPECRRNGDVVERRMSGEGKVVTRTVIHDAVGDYDDETPYTLAIVELEEGPRMTAQVIGDADVGDEVEACFRRVDEEGESGIVQYGTKFKPVND